MKNNPAIRFKRYCRLDNESGCIIWTGGKAGHSRAYGLFYADGRGVYAHRWIYEQNFGRIPPGYSVHHECGNPACVRPDHLRAVTHRQNMRLAARSGSWDGERNGNAKLTARQVRQIRKARKRGFKATHLAEHFGVSIRTIYHVLSGKGWKHIPLGD